MEFTISADPEMLRFLWDTVWVQEIPRVSGVLSIRQKVRRDKDSFIWISNLILQNRIIRNRSISKKLNRCFYMLMYEILRQRRRNENSREFLQNKG